MLSTENSPENLPQDEQPAEISPTFFNLYKNNDKTPQKIHQQHRVLFLERQKEKRTEAFNEKRNLLELFPNYEENSMECEEVKPTSRKYVAKQFKKKLMDSHWFTDIPDDLSSNWLCKLCPQGNRFLLVAHKGRTQCYNNRGQLRMQFQSTLPGGSQNCMPHRFTILDCISNKETNSIFVYDVLAWNNLSLCDAEANMRFSFLKSKLLEEQITAKHRTKSISFVLIDCFPAQREIIQDQMFVQFLVNDIQQLKLDGVLFYHKEGRYEFGLKTPLVGWLKPFMLGELLHIDVHPDHLQDKPDNYENFQEFINGKIKKRAWRRKNRDFEMEGNAEGELSVEENLDS